MRLRTAVLSLLRYVLSPLLIFTPLLIYTPQALQAAEDASVSPEAVATAAASDDAAETDGDADREDEADGDVDAERASIDERLDALLQEALPEDEYREQKRCLAQRNYRSIEVLSTEYLLFYRNNSFWLNRLSRPCPTLRFNDVPVFSSRSTSSICERDAFYPTNRMDLARGFDSTGRPLAATGVCFLGQFEEITADQAALLRTR
ncbi:MAG: hypothetical protein AAGE43_18670 [Pseudomonadota bacterium]